MLAEECEIKLMRAAERNHCRGTRRTADHRCTLRPGRIRRNVKSLMLRKLQLFTAPMSWCQTGRAKDRVLPSAKRLTRSGRQGQRESVIKNKKGPFHFKLQIGQRGALRFCFTY